jgi:hypothetical protein
MRKTSSREPSGEIAHGGRVLDRVVGHEQLRQRLRLVLRPAALDGDEVEPALEALRLLKRALQAHGDAAAVGAENRVADVHRIALEERRGVLAIRPRAHQRRGALPLHHVDQGVVDGRDGKVDHGERVGVEGHLVGDLGARHAVGLDTEDLAALQQVEGLRKRAGRLSGGRLGGRRGGRLGRRYGRRRGGRLGWGRGRRGGCGGLGRGGSAAGGEQAGQGDTQDAEAQRSRAHGAGSFSQFISTNGCRARRKMTAALQDRGHAAARPEQHKDAPAGRLRSSDRV